MFIEKLINKKIKDPKKKEKLWQEINVAKGSIQDLKQFTDEEKEVFKTADEINQIWVVEHAYKRQEFICQAQSVNLFFVPPDSSMEQETHDEYLQYVSDVHWYAMNTLKSLYYFRSDAAKAAENVNVKVPRIKLDEVECIACEG